MQAPGVTGSVVTGRYRIFHAGEPCGEERFRLEGAADGAVLTGEQVIAAPHPFPNRHEYRATLALDGRVRGLEILWSVGPRTVRAMHTAAETRWHARIETGDGGWEQQGDYPVGCEVDYATHLFLTFVLARRDFAVGGEHEFPVLRIGPPWMAVSPEHMKIRCEERGSFEGPHGPVAAARYVASLPPRPEEEGFAFWADEEGFVLESCEGLNPARPWMRLTELRRPANAPPRQ
jgi:hypothetical protein